MKHSELVEIAYKWVLKRCGVAFKEITCQNKEIPDVIGFRSDYSFLIEAKTSKSDFLVDKKKSFRINPSEGVGDFRFFIAVEGLLKIEDLPKDWGLIEVNEKGKVVKEYNPFGGGNMYGSWFKVPKNREAETNIMYSALRRNFDLIKNSNYNK
ncbi:hypothetical protein [Chishuiella sp.]|uniref:hypothetical protein n=1 Tax=Chishuiella sp. TaxID=1969467 RepID=UPI0028B20569|nr:hypothetical protein [Chishuiella sp.]